MTILDAYERRARLVPGLILVAPIGVTIVMFGLNSNPVLSVIIGSLTTFGAPFVLATFVRHKGLAIQDHLWAAWGGKPTTQLLVSGGAARPDRWRSAVEKLAGHSLPDTSASGGEDAFDAAIADLISRTRDRAKFKLVFEENRNYGYERNLLGLRRLGLLVSGACLVGSVTAVTVVVTVVDHSVRADWIVGLIALIALFIVWSVLPSRDRAKVTAFKYAEQLLDAAVELARD